MLSGIFAWTGCSEADEQCLKITKFIIKDASGQEINNLAPGDTIFIEISVKNTGTKKVENGKIFIATRAKYLGPFDNSNYLMPGGQTNTWVSATTGIDFDIEEEVPFSGIQILIGDYVPPTEYEIIPYARSQSDQTFEYQIHLINITNPSTDWVAAVASKMVACEPETNTCAHRLVKDYSDGDISNDLFDMKIDVLNRNTFESSEIRVFINPLSQIKGCDTYPVNFSPANNPTGKLNHVYTFEPGEKKSFDFFNCEFKDELKLVERAFQVIVYNAKDSSYLSGGWPGTKPGAIPLVNNDNLWADQDYLAKGETVKLSSKFYIYNAPLKLGSKAVFTIYNVRNSNGATVNIDPLEYIFSQEEIDKTGKWLIIEASVNLDSYQNDLPAPEFSVRFEVYDDLGNLVNRNYRVNYVTYSPPNPKEVNLANLPAGENIVYVVSPAGFNQVIFTNANVQSTDKITVSGAAGYGFSVVDGKAIYYYSVPTATTVTFKVLIPEVVEIVNAEEGEFRVQITANTLANQILLKPRDYTPSDILVEGAEDFSIEMVKDGYLIHYSVSEAPSNVFLSLAINEAAPAPGIILSTIIILAGISFLALYLNRKE